MRKVVSILKKHEFILKNLDCANCANKIQNKIAENADFKNVIVNFNTLKLTYESENENREIVEKIVKSLEPDVEVVEAKMNSNQEDHKMVWQIIRLVLGIGIAGIGILAGLPTFFCHIFMIIAYAILLYRTIGNAIKIFKTSKSIDENFLVAVSCIGAYLIGESMEGLMVIILYEIGKILEDKAVNRTRKSIANLMDIKPEYANLKVGSETHEIAPEDVNVRRRIAYQTRRKNPIRRHCGKWRG